MQFKKYLIPIDTIIESDIYALENYIDAYESYLFCVAYEANSKDSYDNLTSRAKSAQKKIIEGNRTHDLRMTQDGSNELSSVVNDLKKLSNTETDKKSKRRLAMIAKIIGAIIASICLTIGFVAAGKRIKKMLSSGTTNSDIRDIHKAMQSETPRNSSRVNNFNYQSATTSQNTMTSSVPSQIESNIVEVRNTIVKGEPLLRDSDGSMKSFKAGTVLSDGGVIKNIESAPDQGADTKLVTTQYTGDAARSKKIDQALDTGDFSKIKFS